MKLETSYANLEIIAFSSFLAIPSNNKKKGLQNMMFSLPEAEPPSTMVEKRIQEDDRQTRNDKAPNSSISYVYIAKIMKFRRNVTVTWDKNLLNYSLTINVENLSDESQSYSCKIDIKSWQFWGKKGLKSFDVDGKRLDIYWDFRQAKFGDNPEPSSDYYVALVQDEDVLLLLGDLKTDAYKRTKKRPSLEEPTLLCKKENVYGKKLFCTKSALQNGRQEQDIVVEISSSGMADPEMWISVDGFEVIHVMNLNWRFRGNENVTVDDTSIQIFWDVHDWLFNGSGTGHGLFVIKPGAKEHCSFDEAAVRASNHDINGGGICGGGGDIVNKPDSDQNSPTNSEFIHVIDAWKFD